MFSLLVMLLAAQAPAPFPYGMPRTSYADARALVFANPVPDPLPSSGTFPEIALATDWGPVLRRFGKVVKDPSDFAPAESRVMHRYGVCADAVWLMDAPSNATGLFREGTRVPALLRFSTGTNRTQHLPLIPRTWWLAIKLFPSTDNNEPVVTRNLLLADPFGLDGQARRHFLKPADDDPPLYFSNRLAAHGLLMPAVVFLLGRYDRHPLFRSLAPLAQVDVVDSQPFSVRVPQLVHLVPRPVPHHQGALPEDYREELRRYAPGELVFDVVLPSQPLSPQWTRIGTLTVGDMVVSPACDNSIQFRHPPVPYGEEVP
jgi:hypothetical protein